jgi:hypothetical protein
MKLRYSKKKRINLFLIILTVILCLSSLVLSQEEVIEEDELIEEDRVNETEDNGIDVSKQLFILDSIEKAEEKAKELKNDSLNDERSDKLLSEIKSILETSNYQKLVDELEIINKTISVDLILRIKKGLSLEKKPEDEDYDNVIELRSDIFSRVEFIYNLKENIKNLRWEIRKDLFWNDLSVEIDLNALNRSQEFFDKEDYDKAGEIFNKLNGKIEAKSYQSVEKKEESLNVVLECEKIFESIKNEGFNDKVAKALLKQTKDFFKSKNFYSIINKIEDIDDDFWRDSKELLIGSNSSNEKAINEDYTKLEEFKQKITERKERLRYIQAFIGDLGKKLESDNEIPELNTKEYSEKFNNVQKLFSEHEYNNAFEEALIIELELEDKALNLIIETKEIIIKLDSNNFTTLYLSDLLHSAYDKFAPFQSEALLKKYEESDEGNKLTFIEEELIDVKNAMKQDKESYSFVDFSTIIGTINEIKYREEQIYRLDESIKILSKKIIDYSKQGISSNVSEKKFEEVVSNFGSENYDDAESALFEANTKLELAKARLTVLNVLSVEGLSFLQRYKYHIIIIVILVSAISFFGWIHIRVNLLTKKLKDSIIEKDTLENLIKKIQKVHFADGTMPTSIYNIKYEEYNSRLNTVKAAIPVQETVLSKQIKFNKKAEKYVLNVIKVFKNIMTKVGITGLVKKGKKKKEKRIKNEVKREEHKIGKKEVKKNVKKEDKKKNNGIILSKWVKDIIVTLIFSLILSALLHWVNLLPDLFLRYFILMICFSFFIVFTALLVQRAIVMPLTFVIIALMTRNIDIFDIKGIELIYIFAAMGVLFLLLFYAFKLLIKRYNAPAIISTILVLSLMPLITSTWISFSLTKISLYAVFNISLINLLLATLGGFIALIVWYRFRTNEFMLKMGY